MGLKHKTIEWPHTKEKMFRGPQFMRKKAFHMKSFQNKLNLIKIQNFETLVGTQMRLAGIMLKTPVFIERITNQRRETGIKMYAW